MSDFQHGDEAKFRREVRAMIRRGPFSKAERDVVLAFANHWMHHRSTAQTVHPGREKLAARAKVTIKTVTRCLALLRQFGAIEATAHLNGLHGNATEYCVNMVRLSLLCGKKRDEIRVYGGTNVPTCGRDKMSHRINNVISYPSQDLKLSGGAK